MSERSKGLAAQKVSAYIVAMLLVLAALAEPTSTSEVIIVRAERLQQSVPVVRSLNATLLDASSGQRLDEVLRAVPGVGLFRRTPSATANATIQGLSLRPIAPSGAGRALVSLDGVPQNDPFGGWIHWSRYDPIFLERVDVNRGATGAGFGPSALTGTLDLTEARGQPAALAASVGQSGSVHIAGRQSVRTNGARFTMMGAYQSSDGDYAIGARQRGPVDLPIPFESLALTLVTDIARRDGAWSFRASGFADEKGAGLVGGASQANGLDVSIARRLEGDWGQGRVIIYAQGRDFSNQTVAVSANRTVATPALDQYATPAASLGASLAFAPAQGKRLPTVTVDWRRSEGQTQEYFRYQGNAFTRGRVAGGQQDLMGLGVALPAPVWLGESHWTIDAALRGDYWRNSHAIRREFDLANLTPTLVEAPSSTKGIAVTGRATLWYGPWRTSLYRTFRPPTLNELHRPFRLGNDVTEANAALVPETLWGSDVDFRATRRLWGGQLTTMATLYANQLSDPVTNVTIATGPGVFPRVGFLPAGGSLRERRNVGRIDAVGFEGSLDWSAGADKLSWSLAISATHARVEGGALPPQLTGKRPAQAPEWSGFATVRYPLASNLVVQTTLRGEGRRFEDDLNTRSLSAYGVLDARLTWRVWKTTHLVISGDNMTNSSVLTSKSGDGILSLAQGRRLRLAIEFGL